MPSGEVFVYCCMSGHDLGECGEGGWTLVMKIDGKKVYLVANCLKSSIGRQLIGKCPGITKLSVKTVSLSI